MRVFVFALGAHEDHAIKILSSSGVTTEDKVVVLVTKPISPEVRKAYNSLKEFTSKMGVKKLELIEVPSDLSQGILSIVNAFSDNSEYIVGISEDAGYLVILTFIALILSGRNALMHLCIESSELSEGILIPKPLIKVLQNPLKEGEVRVLQEIVKNPGISDEELAYVIGKKLKTIKSIIASLRNLGLVIRKGRRRGIYSTELGKVIAEVMKP
ncbi:MAG TPA: CRISPR locus-related DNA-binding protein [Acidilobales archaeon]|nr:CRISPR locus-related DNA-binding protein [Acidilobales archaeon]